ncbi:MAG: hypothetical protein OXE17_09150 [Chloroflexi bacterium]|nr:hypothetical protein [Chloroflexota bacterium]
MPFVPDQVSLLASVPIFLASAVAVVLLGVQLAKYGDALATLTGWGRLFVGSILVALATSLPELSNNITAVRIDEPELALGDALGSNMVNILTLAVVALLFGGKRFLRQIAPEQGYLIVLAGIMTGLAVILAAWHALAPGFLTEGNLWQIGFSSIFLIVVYVIGMRIVYQHPPATQEGDEDDVGMTLRHAWVLFGAVSLGVIVSGIFLAQSSAWIAQATGISSGIVGILAVSIVTSMPEVSATIGAARLGAADLAVAGVYGSCVFNVTILSYADVFFRNGVILNFASPEHFVAGSIAVGLILLGGLLIWGRNRLSQPVLVTGLALIAVVYLLGAAQVAILGARG